MNASDHKNQRHMLRRFVIGTALAIGAIFAASPAANAAVTASFLPGAGVLSVFGDTLDNNITISRDAAGAILVNNGAVVIAGGTPTVANTAQIQVFGQAGNDQIALSEVNGALPAANLFGGSENDTITGGSGNDFLFGQAGNDTLLGKGGNDLLFGGADNDVLTGGDGDDQVFGEGGNDRMVWNPGDDSDLNEGGDASDTVEVNGGNGTENFTVTANGARVRFDRTAPAPFFIDIGTTENLVLNANGGDDTFTGSNGLAPLITIVVDGGVGKDTLTGGDGADVLFGGDGNDTVVGGRGNDVAFLGAGDDVFVWNPGDANDTVEGQDGLDTLAFNGANVAENMDISANGSRVRFTRNVANIVMDLSQVENIVVKTLGGADNLVVHDLSGTGVASVVADLTVVSPTGDDGATDNVFVNGTSVDDVASISGAGPNMQVIGLPALITVSGGFAPNDRLTVSTLAGDDVLDAWGVAAGSMPLTLDGGDGNDVMIGGAGDDTLLGGAGDDVLIGGPGKDAIDGGPGNNVVIDDPAANTVSSATFVGKRWLRGHAQVINGKTVVDVSGKQQALPQADLNQMIAAPAF